MLPSVPGPFPARGTLRPPAAAGSALKLPPLQAVRLLDQLRERIRYLHYSRRTEDVYVLWCRAFIRRHGLRHPAEMGGPEAEAFLSYLAAERGLAPSTHKQALSALRFLYGKVLGINLPWMQEIGRPRPLRRLPVVPSVEGLSRLLGHSNMVTTTIYTHVLKLGGGAVRSPLDMLAPVPKGLAC
ncbi:integrase-like protein [Roseateles asaccharophilus]|uniref:Integrase-like protein n=1 Tax=Roseateles asaccharophilus TaxID=582607 RepID=A0A4V3CI92_9BURK|nr:integrase-like protein [Roseateles asaccharophilus]